MKCAQDEVPDIHYSCYWRAGGLRLSLSFRMLSGGFLQPYVRFRFERQAAAGIGRLASSSVSSMLHLDLGWSSPSSWKM